MLKLFFVIFANFHRAPYIVPKMRYMADHPQKYSEAERYDMMRHCIDLMNKGVQQLSFRPCYNAGSLFKAY